MKSVKNIGKITKAMEMISVSKMKKSSKKRLDSNIFAERSLELLKNLHIHKNLSHPYLESREGSKVLMVIISSNKGLCGGYNMNVSKQVTEFAQTNTDKEIVAITIGKQSERIARRNGIKIIGSYTDFSDYYTAGEIRSLLHTITETYTNDPAFEQVVVAYTQFITSLSFKAQVTPFIPFQVKNDSSAGDAEENITSFAEYTFEPGEQEVLDRTVPAVLLTHLYQLLLESLASEHSSRVMAMRNASDNANDMLDELKLNYNRARQAAITQEISEIVGGSSAVS